MKPPATPQKLWQLVHERLDIALPYRVFTPGHSSPMAFVADAIFRPRSDLAVWANRSGLKTLCASIIAALSFRFAGGPLRARVLSGSEDQARNLYHYWRRWCEGLLADRLDGQPGRLLTRLTNGDLEILAASQKRVRGAKVQLLFRDEIDEIDPDVMNASVGMLASSDGLPAKTVDTSTWHRANGPMGRLVAEAAGRGIRLHKWNVWEALAACPPERHDAGRNCEACELAGPCLAKARLHHADPARRLGIAADCHGLLAIDDAVKQFRQWSAQQWQAEAECKRPSLRGLVYPAFDRAVHVIADLAVRADLPAWRAIDWGWNNFVCLWVQADKAGSVHVVDEYCTADATAARNAREIADRDRRRRLAVEATYCDPAGSSRNDQTGYSDVEVFAGCGIPCSYSTSPWAREVRNGINLIRSYLAPACGRPRLFIAARCTQLIRSLESYRNRQVNGEYVDEPVKPQPLDHPADALRYYFVNAQAPCRSETRRLAYT